jgi:hypothetical protein
MLCELCCAQEARDLLAGYALCPGRGSRVRVSIACAVWSVDVCIRACMFLLQPVSATCVLVGCWLAHRVQVPFFPSGDLLTRMWSVLLRKCWACICSATALIVLYCACFCAQQ